jgi:ribosome-binding factor A
MESTRLQKVSRQIQKDLAEYFQRNSQAYLGKLITVTVVRVSPDLSFAKVYLSIFPVDKAAEVMEAVELTKIEIRHDLARKVRHQLRKVPELGFYLDDSIDYELNIERLLND